MDSVNKKAFITGIAGQDGSYLAELLLTKGYEVHGLEITKDKENFWRIRHILDKLTIHAGDVSDREAVKKLMVEIKPDEIYHLATKHDLPNSLENYLAVRATNLDSTYFFLSSIKEFSPNSKFFFASSSRVFGNPQTSPQNERTPLQPNSLYGISKVAASALVKMHRQEGFFACSGIFYNHESPRRDPVFLPRKITRAAARIKLGLEKELKLGDIDARRDWGFSGDYAEAMWLMLQAEKPDDYVIGTGVAHSVKDILDIAFGHVGIDWKKYVSMDQGLLRRLDSADVIADISKIKKELGWEPKTSFASLIESMTDADLKSSEV